MFTIEAPVRLSSSRLWSLNVEFYENQGVGAWTDEVVPTRITSNPMIASAYAQVIAGYLRDVAGKGGRRVTIVELGAGSGQFSYLLLRALEEAVAAIRPNAPIADYGYVISDIAETNVRSWRDNPQLAPSIDGGRVDIAVLDVRAPQRARSIVSDRKLPEIIGPDPVVVIANYVFDSLVCDAFRVEDGQLAELEVGLDCEGPETAVVGGPKLFKQIRFTTRKRACGADHYGDPAYDALLAHYAASLRQGSFLLPTGALDFLAAMRSCAPAGLLALVADKGRSETQDYEGRDSLGIIQTGAFSSMVNFDAIGRWVEMHGGQIKKPAIANDRLDVFALVLGETGRRGETELAFQRAIATCGPNYLHWLVGAVLDAQPEMTPRALTALLEASRFDPRVLIRMGGAFMAALARSDRIERALLERAFERCRRNHFAMGDSSDPNFILGKLYQQLGDPRRALETFSAAKAPASLLAYNMSLCHAELGEKEAALTQARRSVDARLAELRGAAA